MPAIWSRPHRISPHLQFLFNNAPIANPDWTVNITCGGSWHVEGVSAGQRNSEEYGRRYVFVSPFIYHDKAAFTMNSSVFAKNA